MQIRGAQSKHRRAVTTGFPLIVMSRAALDEIDDVRQ
jgi:hypothetical protein